jgi:hypothetical protein
VDSRGEWLAGRLVAAPTFAIVEEALMLTRQQFLYGSAAAALLPLPKLAWADAAPADLQDPEAMAILQTMSDYLAKAQAFSFHAYSLYDTADEAGIKIKRAIFQQVTVRRPDRMRFHTSTDDGLSRDGYYDGAHLYIVPSGDKPRYAEIDVPPSLDEMLDYVQDNYPINVPAVDLLYSDVAKTVKENLLSAEYVGLRDMEGDKLDQMSFESTGADWQLWVAHGNDPLPRRLVISFVAEQGEPEYLTIIRDWNLSPAADDALFQFTPGADAERFEIAKNPPAEEKKQ